MGDDDAVWRLATDAAGIGLFSWDVDTGEVLPDDRLRALLEYGPGDVVRHIDDVLSRMPAEDRWLLERAAARAVESRGDYRAEFRVVLGDGSVRWLSARGRAVVRDGSTWLVGAAYDVTDIRNDRDRAAHVLATMSSGYLSIDREWRVRYLNVEAERALGRTADQLRGKNLWEEFPGARERAFGHHYPLAMSTGEVVAFEEYFPALRTWFEVRAIPGDEGLEVYFLDITQRRRAQEAARTAAERLELLADVSGELAATLDAEEAVAQLARLLVPALASWCIVTLRNDDGTIRDVGWWHDDPALRPVVEEYARERTSALKDTSFVARALRTGQPQIIRGEATERVQEVLRPGRAHDLIGELAPEYAMILPLSARGRTVGLVSLFLHADRGLLDPNDVVTAREVATRAALALDNTRLYRQQADLAEGLQRSLLTAPPQVEGIQIVVRYQPAAQVAAVGGDWYDAFLQPDGTAALIIGDVVGHDTEAAAAMGQLRGLLRGIAYRTGADPAQVLAGLDTAMEGLTGTTTATAIVALLSKDGDHGHRLRWSSAGHPPPMLLHPDGRVEALGHDSPDLLLGLDPLTPRTSSELAAEPGMTLLLYTDGLVERRGQSIDEGLDLLTAALKELATDRLDAGALADELLRRLLPDEPEDDVALVVVRVAD